MTVTHSYQPEPRDLEPLIAASRAMIDEGQPLESVWQFLRAEGCHWGDSIQVTMRATGMAHRDAKRAVYHSDTWSDLRPAIDYLHDSIEKAIEELAAEGEIELSYSDPVMLPQSR